MSGLVGSLVMEPSQVVDTILSVDKRICVKVIAVADGPAVRDIRVRSSTGTPSCYQAAQIQPRKGRLSTRER